MASVQQVLGRPARALIIATSVACACGSSLLAQSSANAQTAAPVATTLQATLAGDLLAYTVRLTVRVVRADDSAKLAEQIAQRHGGRLIARRDGDLTVQAPVGRLEQVVRELAGLGVELGRNVEVKNVTEQWLDAQAKLRSAEQSRVRLWGMGRQASEGVKDPIRLQQQIARVDDEIASIHARIHGLESQGAQALVELRLEAMEGVETEALPEFELPFEWLSRLGLERLMNLAPTYEPPEPESYHLHDEGEVSMGLSFVRPSEPDKLGDTPMTVAAGMRVRGMFEADPVGPAIGMDLNLGGGTSGGFLYDLRMMVGPGWTIGRHFSFGAVTGAGISGVTGDHVPCGVDLPIEAFVATDVTEYAQVRLWGRSAWLVASDDRQNGADHAPFGDELYSGASFILGEDSDGVDRERIGLALGVWYGEMLGTRIGGLSIGYGGGFGDRRMELLSPKRPQMPQIVPERPGAGPTPTTCWSRTVGSNVAPAS